MSVRVMCVVAQGSDRTKSSRRRSEMGVDHVRGLWAVVGSVGESIRRDSAAAVKDFVVLPL